MQHKNHVRNSRLGNSVFFELRRTSTMTPTTPRQHMKTEEYSSLSCFNPLTQSSRLSFQRKSALAGSSAKGCVVACCFHDQDCAANIQHPATPRQPTSVNTLTCRRAPLETKRGSPPTMRIGNLCDRCPLASAERVVTGHRNTLEREVVRSVVFLKRNQDL